MPENYISLTMPENYISRQNLEAVASSPGDFELQVIRDESTDDLLGGNIDDEHAEVFHSFRSSEVVGSRSDMNSGPTDGDCFIASGAIYTVSRDSFKDGNGSDGFVEKSDIATTTSTTTTTTTNTTATTDEETATHSNIDNWTLKTHPDWQGLSPGPGLFHRGPHEQGAETGGLTPMPSPIGSVAREILKEAQKITGLVFKLGRLFRKSDRKQTDDVDDGTPRGQSLNVKGSLGSHHGNDEASACMVPPLSADWTSNGFDDDDDDDEDTRTLLKRSRGTTNLNAPRRTISTEDNIEGRIRGHCKGQREPNPDNWIAISSDKHLQQAVVLTSQTISLRSILSPEGAEFKGKRSQDPIEIHGDQQPTIVNNNYDYIIDLSGLDPQLVGSNPSLNFEIKSNKTSSGDERESSVSEQKEGDPSLNERLSTPPLLLLESLGVESSEAELKTSPPRTAHGLGCSECLRPLREQVNSTVARHCSPIKRVSEVVKVSANDCFCSDRQSVDQIQSEICHNLPRNSADLQKSLIVEELKVKLENIIPSGIPNTVMDNSKAVQLEILAVRENQVLVQGHIGECTEDQTWEQTGYSNYSKVPNNSPNVVVGCRNSPSTSLLSLTTSHRDGTPNAMVTSGQRHFPPKRHDVSAGQPKGRRTDSTLDEHVVVEQTTRVSQQSNKTSNKNDNVDKIAEDCCENLFDFRYFLDSATVEITFDDKSSNSNSNNNSSSSDSSDSSNSSSGNSFDIDDILVAYNNNKNKDSKLVDESLDLSLIVERNIPNDSNNNNSDNNDVSDDSLLPSGKPADFADSVAKTDATVDNIVVESDANLDNNDPDGEDHISTISVSNFATSHPAFLEKLMEVTARKVADVSTTSSQSGLQQRPSQTKVVVPAEFENGTDETLLKTSNFNDNVASSRPNYINDNNTASINGVNDLNYSGYMDRSDTTLKTTKSESSMKYGEADADKPLLHSTVDDTLTSTPVTHKVITYCPVERSPMTFDCQERNSFKEPMSYDENGHALELTSSCQRDFVPSAEQSLGYLKDQTTASNDELNKNSSNNDTISFNNNHNSSNDRSSRSSYHVLGASSTPVIHSSSSEINLRDTTIPQILFSSPDSTRSERVRNLRKDIKKFGRGRDYRMPVRRGTSGNPKECQFRSLEALKL